jgi:hypothetical protein
MEAFSNYTEGDWREYTHKDVVAHIRRVAGDPTFRPSRRPPRKREML